MKAVYFDSNWPETELFGGKILVTYVEEYEDDTDALVRAFELYGNQEYYIAEVKK